MRAAVLTISDGVSEGTREDESGELLQQLLEENGFEVELAVGAEAVEVTASAETTAQTGVEMEALTAVSIACLTIYDMAKAVDRGMTISEIRLREKSGGASGDWRAGD